MGFNRVRLKIASILIAGCLISISSQAQFAQMLQTMLQQIAALEGYIATAEKGYKIAEDGLHTIGDIKNGEFNLHSVFFQSLKTVNPQVKSLAEVTEIASLQISIVQATTKKIKSTQQSQWLHPDEMTFIVKVYGTLVAAGVQNLSSLSDIITDNKVGMTDGERMRRIQSVDTDMQKQYAFLLDFSNQTDLLQAQRQRDDGDNQSLKKLYGF
jgi:prophage DNA circulation protein